MFLSPGADVYRTTAVPGDLDDDMGRRSKPIDAQSLAGLELAASQGPVADDARTKQWSSFSVVEDARKRIGEVLVNQGIFGEPSVGVVAGELRLLAEVLVAPLAKGALPTGPAQPGDAQPIAYLKPAGFLTQPVDDSYDLMTWYQRGANGGQLSLDDVQVCAADSTGTNLHPHLMRTGLRIGNLL
jgi:hypothetical protein